MKLILNGAFEANRPRRDDPGSNARWKGKTPSEGALVER